MKKVLSRYISFFTKRLLARCRPSLLRPRPARAHLIQRSEPRETLQSSCSVNVPRLSSPLSAVSSRKRPRQLTKLTCPNREIFHDRRSRARRHAPSQDPLRLLGAVRRPRRRAAESYAFHLHRVHRVSVPRDIDGSAEELGLRLHHLQGQHAAPTVHRAHPFWHHRR